MMKKIKTFSVCLLLMSALFFSSIGAEAAAMSTFPAQNTSSFSVQYTRAIQVMMLNFNSTTRAYINNSGGVDGSFGPATKNAVIAFQVANGLTPDGSCGPATWTKLNNTLISNGTSGGYVMYKGQYPYTTNCMKRAVNAAMDWYCFIYNTWFYVG